MNNIKTIKIFLILIAAVIIIVEGLYVFGLSAYVNSILKSGKVENVIKKHTGLILSFDSAKVKTYPDFSIRLVSQNLELADSASSKIISAKNIDTRTSLVPLLLKKLSVKSLKSEDLFFYLSRKQDKKLYLGNYPLNINFENPKDINIDVNGVKLRNANIVFDDKIVNKNISIKINAADFYYKKNKSAGLVLKSQIYINNSKKTDIFVNYSSKLPLQKGLDDRNFVCDGYIKNMDLSDYSGYLAYLTNQEIVSSSGIVNSEFRKEKDFVINSTLSNFKLNMKNPLDSMKSESTIQQSAVLNFENNKLIIKSEEIKAKDWFINIKGSIKNYTAKNPKQIKLDLDIEIPESNIHSMYWVAPSIKDDPQDVMQKFKKYGAWGKAKGKLQIKGSADAPEVYGDLAAYDVYIVKNNPLVPRCRIDTKFMKKDVKVTTRVFTGFGEYVDVEGIAEIKINGRGDFVVKSSPNVDLATVKYMLVPIHEVVGFDLGPVPYMGLDGKGNIEIHTLGSVIDGEVTGQFNFKNTTASLDGLNTLIHNANGSLVFDHKDLHFYTKSAFIKNKPMKIDGIADLSGNIDFDVTSENIDLSDLLDILNTSPMLDSRKVLAEPIKEATGKVATSIKIKGIVKDFSEILGSQTLVISGKLNLRDVKAVLKHAPIPVEKLNGLIEFDNDGWKIDLSGLIASSKIKIKGYADESRIDIKADAQAINTDEILQLFIRSSKNKFHIHKLPKTNSLVFFNAHYKSHFGIKSSGFDLNNLTAEGYFKPISAKSSANEPFGISQGVFNISKGTLILNNFSAKLYDSKIFANAKIEKFFSTKPVISGQLNMSDFDVASFNDLKKMTFFPSEIRKILNAYESYQGNANVFLKCKNNNLDGYIDLKDIKFNHSYFKTPVSVDSGKIILDDSKLTMKSIIAQIDNTPVFLTLSVWDFDKTMQFSGYFTTKLTEYFANKYINGFLAYPLKPKGDITLTADINGNLKDFRVRPKIKFAKDADIYYMGADLGDESDEREIYGDITVAKNTYYLRKLEYVRYMTSQNDKTYPLVILNANGIIDVTKKGVYARTLNIETINNANVKMFNAIFKKSVLKNGMFNCKLNVKGDVNNPKIRGKVSMDNIDMPLYETVLKNVVLDFRDKNIDIKANGLTFNSDFTLKASMNNTFRPPFIIESIDLNSEKLNLDTFIDSLTQIPTPDMAMKISGATKTSSPLNISDFQIKQGEMRVKDIIIRDLPANNFTADFVLGKDMVLKLDKLWFDVTTGKMTGNASYNFANGRIKANVSALNVDSNKVASSLFGVKDQIFGQANGTIILTTRGNSEEERIKNIFGYVYFEMADGKLPKLGSVEYLLKAGSALKSGITGASLSNFIDLISPIKTGSFDSIKGNFSMKNGVAQNIEVYSKGDNLNIYINGEFDILQQYADLRVYGRLTKKATNILGAVGNLSFNSLLNAIPGFKLDKEDKTRIVQDLNKIPGVELTDREYRVFTVKIDGKLNDEKFVKNFRWIE